MYRKLIVAVVIAAAACGGGDGPTGSNNSGGGNNGGTTPPSASNSTYDLTLTSPNTDDAGIMFLVNGATVDSVTVPAARTSYSNATSSGARVVVVGTIQSGVIATVWAHGTPAATPTVTVEQAAQANTFAQRSVSNYSVTVTKR